MVSKKYMVYGLALLFSSTDYASQPVSIKEQSAYLSTLRSFAAFTLGADFLRTGRAQTLSLVPPFNNYYTANESFKSSGNLGLTAGAEQRWTDTLSWQLGLSGYFNSEVNTTGHVWQFALPEYDNFTYHYRIQSKRLLASGKLLGTVKQALHPYVSAELGAAFNRASSYDEIALIEEMVPMAPFSNHTKTSLAWGVGAGLDVNINPAFRLGAGYQFADLGKVKLGRSPAQLTQQTLGLPHLYSHQLRFQLTAFI